MLVETESETGNTTSNSPTSDSPTPEASQSQASQNTDNPSTTNDNTANNSTASETPEDTPWPEVAADVIADAVTSVRKMLLKPVAGVARKLVYGLVALVLLLIVLVVGLIALVVVLDSYLPSGGWLALLVLGGIFTLGGLFIWFRRPKGAAS